MDLQCNWLSTMILFHPEHGYTPLSETNCYFADGTSWTVVPGLIHFVHWWIFVMYFGHQMLFWPHTLGGIYYNPKLHQTCIPGIMPSYLLSFPSHHWTTLLKPIVLKVYMPYTTISRVHTLVERLHLTYTQQKSWKMKIEYGYGFLGHYLTVWPSIASHSNCYYLFWPIK